VDFHPFRILSDMPLAMTAHVVYSAIDPKRPATTSPTVIRRIRDDLGFSGLLMSDDLSMRALEGDFAERTRRSLRAGCDVVLHCNGNMAEMTAIFGAVKPLTGVARRRAQAALARIPRTVEPLDLAQSRDRFAAAFGVEAA
jgi:beta-N-acetylhexosaminidase